MKKIIASAIALGLSTSAFAIPFVPGTPLTNTAGGKASSTTTASVESVCQVNAEENVAFGAGASYVSGDATIVYYDQGTDGTSIGSVNPVGYSKVAVAVDDYSAGFTPKNTDEIYTKIKIGDNVAEEITGAITSTKDMTSSTVDVRINYLAVYGDKGFTDVAVSPAPTFTISCTD